MRLRIGLLGLPNVGKSSLFNALARESLSLAANYPFATVDPHRAAVAVPDPGDYLERLGALAGSARTVPATAEWLDVAGLARGAHRGEGLGNRFLGLLRECGALCHVLRLFEDRDVAHVDGRVDPRADAEAIQLELLFADLDHVQRRLGKTNVPEEERRVLERVLDGLERGSPANSLGLDENDQFAIKSMGLLTLKPVMYSFNVDEIDFTMGRQDAESKALELVNDIASSGGSVESPVAWALVSAKLESQLAQQTLQQQTEYFSSLGIDHEWENQLCYRRLPSMAKELLGAKLVYTGPGVPPERSRTCRAHLFVQLSPHELAGRLHGDIADGFLGAEVAPAEALLGYPKYHAAKEAGVVRTEGRDYAIQDNDVVLIRWKSKGK